jgi:hypothetical protein
MELSHTTDELVKILKEGNEELLDLIGSLDEHQMDKVSVHGFRSVKDILAHLTHWNKHGVKWIESVYCGEKPVMPVKGNSQEAIREEMALVNAEVHSINRGRSVSEVLEEYGKTFDQVLDKVSRLEEEHLESLFDYPWANEPVSGRRVVMWRHWHLQNHMKHIKTWLSK